MDKKKNILIYGILLMILSSICTCFGQLMWKLAVVNGNEISFYMFGFILYGIGAAVMIIAFRFGELSILHPMLSLGFILSIILGAFFLDEKITLCKVVGIGFVVIGMIFLGQSAKEEVK